jgi:putative PEP-CTERM system TPR-repeat lipoprotein
MLLRDRRAVARCSVALAGAALWVLVGAFPAGAEDAQTYLSEAKSLLAKGDLKGAEIELRNAVREKPDDAGMHAELAKLYLRLNNLPAAEAEARQARQYHGDANVIDPVLAQALSGQGKYPQLFGIIQPGEREPAVEAQIRLMLGTAHLVFGELGDAGPLLAQAEQLDPEAASPKIAMARFLMIQHKLDDARAEILRALELHPNNADAMLVYGKILVLSGDSDKGLAQFDEVLKQQPNNVEALQAHANVQMGRGDFAAASKEIDRALKLVPNNIYLNLQKVLVLAQQGKIQEADDLNAKLGDNFSTVPFGYYVKGALKFALGQYEQADQALTRFLARSPSEPNARRLLARIALLRHDPARAIATLKPVVDADPGDVQALYILAEAYLASGQRGRAVAVYQRAAEALPDNPYAQARSALMNMQNGDLLQGFSQLQKLATTENGAKVAGPIIVADDLRSGKLNEAASAAEDLVQRNKNDVVAQSLLGTVRMAQQNYPAAIDIFEALIKRDPALSQVRLNLSAAYVAAQQVPKAEALWNDALRLQPQDAQAMRALAEVLIIEQKYDAAIEQLKSAAQLVPQDPAVGLRLLDLYAVKKDWNEAKSLGRDLEGRFPDRRDVVDAVAMVYVNSGDLAGAVSEFQKLVSVSPNSPELWERYARFQSRAGDMTGARASLMKAVSISPVRFSDMEELVQFDQTVHGPEAALATARAFAPKLPALSALLVAQVLVATKRSDEAIEQLQQAQKQSPSTLVAIRLAELLYANGKRSEAEDMLSAWIKDHNQPMDVGPASLSLANLYTLDHNDALAEATYNRVLEISPDNELALNNLAAIYSRKGDNRARDFAERAYRQSPLPQTADTLGWIMVKNGDPRTGLVFLRRAGTALPGDLNIQYHLAVALDKSGNKQDARLVLERVLNSSQTFEGRADAERLFTELQKG